MVVHLWVCTCVHESVFKLLYLWNAWRYFNETRRNYSLLGPHENNDIYKVIGLKLKVSHRNLMNSLACKMLKAVEQKRTQIME